MATKRKPNAKRGRPPGSKNKIDHTAGRVAIDFLDDVDMPYLVTMHIMLKAGIVTSPRQAALGTTIASGKLPGAIVERFDAPQVAKEPDYATVGYRLVKRRGVPSSIKTRVDYLSRKYREYVSEFAVVELIERIAGTVPRDKRSAFPGEADAEYPVRPLFSPLPRANRLRPN